MIGKERGERGDDRHGAAASPQLLAEAGVFARFLRQTDLHSTDSDQERMRLWLGFRLLVAGVNVNGTQDASDAATRLQTLFDANAWRCMMEREQYRR
ncbi:MAG: hypothetical protein M3P18_19730 [Actinomycetota bacterium]|nr:hypothetical protein [Actinomycetota bacterium]